MRHIQINLNVLIHKVKLQVRFPCSLLAFLKVQSQEVGFGSEVPLRVGEAYLELSAAHRFSLYFDTARNTFSEKKISICVYLTTSSGRIPAGAASIHTNMLKRGNNKVSLNIQKCPDKNAFIETSISYQILNEIQFIKSQQHITNLPLGESFGQKTRQRMIEVVQSDVSSPKASQGSDLKKSFARYEQLQKSKTDSSKKQNQYEIEQSTFARKKQDEKSDRQYISNSPTNDYTSKIKLSQLEKQLKTVQKKYEQSTMELKSANSKKDILQRGLKQAQGQLKIYKQKYEDSVQSSENIQKRFDYKESSYKEQIKNLTQKLTASQNQKQQMIFQKNDLVTEFQEREKTLRLSIREKEKQLTEERNRLAKRNEVIVKELADMQAKTGQYELKIVELSRDSTGLTKNNELLEDKCQTLTSQIDQLKQSFMAQKNKRQQLEESLANNLDLEDQKKKLKKKIAQQEQQISKHLKNIAQLDSNHQKQIKKTQQVEAALKDKTNAIKNLQKDNDNLGKDIEILKKSLQQKQKKIEELNNVKQGQSSKVEGLSEQLRQLQKKSSQEARNLKKQIKQKEAKIQNLCKESEDQVDTINDYNSKIQSLEVEVESLNGKFIKLQQQHEQLLKSKSTLEEEVIELEVTLSSQVRNKEQLEISLKGEINSNQETIKKLQQIIKKLQNNSAHQEEEDAYRISVLQQKIATLENEVQQYLSQIDKFKGEIKALQQAKVQGLANNQQLQYTIKIKNNEIAFLKETAQKNHQEINDLTCENKEIQINSQKLNDRLVELEIEIESLNSRLNEVHQNGQGVQRQLKDYIKANKEKIAAYLNAFLGGSKIQFTPVHQEADIQQLMTAAINKVNEVYTNYEQKNNKLEAQLQAEKNESNQLRLEVEERLQENEELRNNLEEEYAKNHEHTQSSSFLISQLKDQLLNCNNQISSLQSELENLKQVNTSLSEELDSLNSALESKSDQNSMLKSNIEQLQDQVKQKEREFSMTQSRQSNKFEEESTSLKSIISALQDQAKIQANKLAELTSKFNEKTKDYKQLERQTSEEIKRLTNQNEKLNAQIAKQSKQIEAKGNLNNKYSEIQTDLRKKLQQAGKDNAALKELNETIRKRNEKAAQKQKQLQETIATLKGGQSQLSSKQSDLQKLIKQRTAQFVASREQNYALDKEKQKISQELQIANALIKVKEDTHKKLEASIKSLQSEKVALKDKVKVLQLSSTEYQKKSQKEISFLNETKDKYDKELEVTKLKLETAQKQILNLSKNSQQATKQQAEQIKELKLKIKDLEDKLVLAAKNLADQEKAHSTEDQYLRPVRDNLQLLKGHMAEYSRVGDQFESNKNKLLKLTTVKAELPTDKYIGERIREVSFAYNKLKVFILGSELSQSSKNIATEEIKRVQLALDRVLRGEK